MEPEPKRRRLSRDGHAQGDTKGNGTLPDSLSRSVSPPRIKRSRAAAASSEANQETATSSSCQAQKHERAAVFKSPFQLTWVRDLPKAVNIDAVTLKDILGDPLIAECWNFNYLHDVDFLMAAFDEDVRQSVLVNVVHGSWMKEDVNRLMLQVSALLELGTYAVDLHACMTGGCSKTQERQSTLRLHARDVWDTSLQDAHPPSPR